MTHFTPTTGFVNIGEFFVCNCSIPLAKRTGLHEYEVIRYHNGKRTAVTQRFDGEGYVFGMKCQTCGRGFNYIIVKETIGIVDKVRVVNTPSSDIIKE